MKILRFIFNLLLIVFTALVITACTSSGDPAPWLAAFFAGYSGEKLLMLIVAGVLGLSQGLFPQFSLFDFIKNLLKVQDKIAHYLIVGLSMLLGALVLWVTGEVVVSEMSFALMPLLETFGYIYVFSQLGFKQR